MASNIGRKAVRDLLVLSYLDDGEFLMLYDANFSKDIYPYWKFNKFDLDAWNDTECQTELRFAKKYLHELLEILQLPEKNHLFPRHSFVRVWREGLCIFLKRLSFLCRYIYTHLIINKRGRWFRAPPPPPPVYLRTDDVT